MTRTARGALRDAIVDLLVDGTPRTRAQVAEVLGLRKHQAKEALDRMVTRGIVARDVRDLPLAGAPGAARAYTLLANAERLPRGDNPWPAATTPRQWPDAAAHPRRRPHGALQAAIVGLLADGVPWETSAIGRAVGATEPGIRTALQQAARSGVVARDRRARHMGPKQRLWTLPQFAHRLPDSDRPRFEAVIACTT